MHVSLGGKFPKQLTEGSSEQVCDRIAEGRVPECAAGALALSKLTPLRKPGGGVRLIAAPNILRRLVGRALA